MDGTVIKNLQKIQNDVSTKDKSLQFLARYLVTFPFLQRIDPSYLCEQLKLKKIEIVCYDYLKLVPVSPHSHVYLVLNGKVVL